jgi:hypothetical protein
VQKLEIKSLMDFSSNRFLTVTTQIPVDAEQRLRLP